MFAERSIKVAVVPDPFSVAPPGDAVIVHVPVAGRPLNATLPVATAQVGCVIVPITGAAGALGCTSITTLADAGEVQVAALVTVNV